MVGNCGGSFAVNLARCFPHIAATAPRSERILPMGFGKVASGVKSLAGHGSDASFWRSAKIFSPLLTFLCERSFERSSNVGMPVRYTAFLPS